MSEKITQSRYEDAIANTNSFLATERGASIDGAFASGNITERVTSVAQRAAALLTSVAHPKQSGLYVPLSKNNHNYFDEAATVLPGYLVLVPSALAEPGTSSLYPAVVSEDGLKQKNSLRLHVLKQPYRQEIGQGASIVLSAAGQSETKGIGEHGRKANDGIEAEHFATLLAAGSDKAVQDAWVSGKHINHTWRKQANNSVTTEVSKRLFGQDIPQTTITISKQQVETNKAAIFWHEGLRDQNTGKPEAATKDKALLVIQGLGFEALRNRNPNGIDDIKRLIS